MKKIGIIAVLPDKIKIREFSEEKKKNLRKAIQWSCQLEKEVLFLNVSDFSQIEQENLDCFTFCLFGKKAKEKMKDKVKDSVCISFAKIVDEEDLPGILH